MKKNAGFTLIEILIVVVILTIVASMALLATGDFGRDRRIREASAELQSVCTLLQTHAMITGGVFGIRFNPNNYQFYEFDTEKQSWHELAKQKLFVRTNLPQGMHFVVVNPITEANQPNVTMLPGGELSPLQVNIQNETTTVATLEVEQDRFQLREQHG